MINSDNTNTITPVDNINNLEIVADNVANVATNAESIDTESTNTDNVNNAEIENVKSEDIVMSNDNEDNPAMNVKDSPHAASSDDNAENVAPGETSTEDVPSPVVYGRKTTNPSKVKTSRKHISVRVKPLESSMGDPPADNKATGKAKGHAFDPTDVQVYEFFIQGVPNPKDLEGVEEDQLLDIQRTIQKN